MSVTDRKDMDNNAFKNNILNKQVGSLFPSAVLILSIRIRFDFWLFNFRLRTSVLHTLNLTRFSKRSRRTRPPCKNRRTRRRRYWPKCDSMCARRRSLVSGKCFFYHCWRKRMTWRNAIEKSKSAKFATSGFFRPIPFFILLFFILSSAH